MSDSLFAENALTVSEITQSIKSVLEQQFSYLFIQGEISNFKSQSSGHWYFSLKDATAQISAVMFRLDAKLVPFEPKDGDQIVIKGEISVYPPRGNYQVIVRHMRPYGIGQLLLMLEKRKKELAALGYFDASRKKKLPLFFTTVAVVTSPTGAVIRDILHVLNRRLGKYHLIVSPVKVQGTGAALEIAQAIEEINQYRLADVIIVARGGGSLEDLWAFNECVVVEAIFRSEIPVISAVGHETDITLSDLVADLRAPTPSVAAELVSQGIYDFKKKIAHLNASFDSFIISFLKRYKSSLYQLCRQSIFYRKEILFRFYWQKVDEILARLDQAIRHKLMTFFQKINLTHRSLKAHQPFYRLQQYKKQVLRLCDQIEKAWNQKKAWGKQKLVYLESQLNLSIRTRIEERKKQFAVKERWRTIDSLWLFSFRRFEEKFSFMRQSLLQINPKQLLQKGYVILSDPTSLQPLTSCSDLHKEALVSAAFSDGTATLQVKEICCEKPS